MRYANNIEMRVFCKEFEDEPLIISKIKELFPFDFDKERIKIDVQNTLGFEDKKIKILTVFVSKERHLKAVLSNILTRLSAEDKQMMVKQLHTRLDSGLHFYFRLEKDELLLGRYMITDSGNCFRFDMSVAAHPHKKEVAEEVVKMMLDAEWDKGPAVRP